MQTLDSYLDRFLTGNFDVAVLKGQWGVGKTRYWNDFIKRKIQAGHARLTEYSYVSLYGLNSIEQVRNQIFQNAKSWGSDQPVEVPARTRIFSWGRNASRVIGEHHGAIPGGQRIAGTVNAISRSQVKNYLVCFDDLERKGDKLELKEIMGLVDELSQQRSCKVLIIFNEDALSKNDSQQYGENREKVVDAEFLYEPGIQRNVDLIFKPGDFCAAEVAYVSDALEISNIRILKKIKMMLDVHEDAFVGCKPQVIEDFGRHATLLTWAYFSMTGAEDLQQLKSRILKSPPSTIKMDQSDQLTASCKDLHRAIGSLAIRDTKFQTPIVRYLEKGTPNIEQIKKARVDAEAVVGSQEDRDAWNRAWRLYEECFSDDEEEIISLLQGLIRSKYLLNANFTEFLKVLDLFEALGVQCDEWVDLFIAHNHSQLERGYFDAWKEIGNARLAEAMKKMRVDSQPTRWTLDDILERLVRFGTFGQEELGELQHYTADDLYIWLKADGKEKSRKIKKGLILFWRGKALSPEAQAGVDHVLQIIREAFTRLAKESALNRLRINEHYDFTLIPPEALADSPVNAL